MTARALLGTVLALLTATAAWAQEVRFTGHVETDHISYFEPRGTERRTGRSQVLAQVDGAVTFGRPLRLFGAVELRTDFADHDRDRVYLDELYADIVYKAFDLRVGRQIISWGKADLVNPTDHLSPRDFTDPLESDDERIGVFAVRPRVQWRGVLMEGAIVPVFSGSVMPAARSRWAPPFPLRVPNPADPGQKLPVTVEFTKPREPATTWANVQYATRVSGTWRGWDLSASYFDGWDDVPRLGMELSMSGVGSGVGTATALIRPEHLRKRAVGGDVATVVGPFTVRGEAAYIKPDPQRGPGYVQYVVGAERTIGDMMGSGGTFVLVQWIHSILPDGFAAAPLDFDYLFQRATTARVQHNVTASVQVAAEGLYEWARAGYYLQPSASYRLGDRVRLEGSIDLLGGRKDEFFGLFADNRRVQFRVRYSF